MGEKSKVWDFLFLILSLYWEVMLRKYYQNFLRCYVRKILMWKKLLMGIDILKTFYECTTHCGMYLSKLFWMGPGHLSNYSSTIKKSSGREETRRSSFFVVSPKAFWDTSNSPLSLTFGIVSSTHWELGCLYAFNGKTCIDSFYSMETHA